jgi:hypothetical protein
VKKSTNIIYYAAGCYGTFFEWVLNFLENPNIELPFKDTGSSHKFKGNLFWPREKLFEYINSSTRHRFSRIHPDLFEKVNQHNRCHEIDFAQLLEEDLLFLKNHFDNTLILTYDTQSILWYENNLLDKTLLTEEQYKNNLAHYGYTTQFLKGNMTADSVLRIRYLLEREINSEFSSFTIENLKAWGKDNIHDFEIWELRELLSFYWFTRNKGQLDAWNYIKQLPGNTMYISISDLRTQFLDIVINSAKFVGISINNSQIDKLIEIYQQWLSLQKQITKDELCNKIVSALCNNTAFDWSDKPMSIVDEAMIQKKLFENNVGIKCDKLNIFPTNTDDFKILLENI